MRRYQRELPYLVGIVLGLAVLIAFGFPGFRAERVGHSDFSYIWAGGRAVLDGLDPYQPGDWRATVVRYGVLTGPEDFYVYPGWATLAIIPFAALPVRVASETWTLGGMALAALALRALLFAVAPRQPATHTLAGVALFASQPGIGSYWSGQWSFLLVAALATAVLGVLRGGLARTAASLVLLGKAHLFTFMLLALARGHVARGQRRELAALVTGCALVVAAGWIAFPAWIRGYVGGLDPRLAGVRQPTTMANGMGDLMGAPGVLLAAAVLLVAVALALRLAPASEEGLAVWSALSLAGAVYTWSYDHLLLIVPLTMSVALAARDHPGPARLIAGAAFGAFLLGPTLLYVIADARSDESYSVLVPIATSAFALAVAFRHRTASFREGDAA